MARRKPYSKLEKEGQVRPDHVQGMGDVLFKGFHCLSPECRQFIAVRHDEIGPDFRITCPTCAFAHEAGGESKFFSYRLRQTEEDRVIEEGDFVVLHDDYVTESLYFKYCVLCYSLKPVSLFSRHAARASGYQGECRLCKTLYNGIKNQSRITDQHREAAQRRRLYRQLATETGRVDSRAVFEKFGGKCFHCDTELVYTDKGQREFHLDHTLPARLLWPLTTVNATLLCRDCNNEKHDKWPSEYYDDARLRALARLTGFEYAVLAGSPLLNDDAVAAIVADTDSFIETWIHYPEGLKRVRELIRDRAGVDIFGHAEHVPDHLREPGELDSLD